MSEEGQVTAPERFWLIPSKWGFLPQATRPTKSEGIEYVRAQPPTADAMTAAEILEKYEPHEGCAICPDCYRNLKRAIATALAAAKQRPTDAVEGETEAAAIVRYCESIATPFAQRQGFVESALATAKQQGRDEQRERDMRAICSSCAEPERFGPPRQVEGSTRWWHRDNENSEYGDEACSAWMIIRSNHD